MKKVLESSWRSVHSIGNGRLCRGREASGPTRGYGYGRGIISPGTNGQDVADTGEIQHDTSSCFTSSFRNGRAEDLYADPKAGDAAIWQRKGSRHAEAEDARQNGPFKLEQRKVYTPEQLQKLAESGYGPVSAQSRR
jgi:hypothetical protein